VNRSRRSVWQLNRIPAGRSRVAVPVSHSLFRGGPPGFWRIDRLVTALAIRRGGPRVLQTSGVD
jgi:hypothetical protein